MGDPITTGQRLIGVITVLAGLFLLWTGLEVATNGFGRWGGQEAGSDDG